jgi:hypothetical protein
MAISVRQITSVNNTIVGSGTLTVTLAFSLAIVAGNTLVVAFTTGTTGGAPTFVSLADTLLNSYSPATNNSQSGISDGFTELVALGTNIYFAANSPGGSNTVTLKLSIPFSGGCDLVIFEIAGLGATPGVDQTATANGTTFPPSFSLTPVAANTIALGAFSTFFGTNSFPIVTAGSGWTLDSGGHDRWNGTDSGAPGGLVGGAAAIEQQILSSNSPISVAISTDSSGDNWVGCACTLSAVAASTFSISGNVGTAFATVSFSGTASGSVTADGSGNYSIPNLPNGVYLVSPSKAGTIFSPTNQSVTISGGNVTGINFTASAAPSGGTSGWLSVDLDSSMRGLRK